MVFNRLGLLSALLLIAISFAIPNGLVEAAPWTHEKGKVYTHAGLPGQRLQGEMALRAEFYDEYRVTRKWAVNAQLEALTFPERAGRFRGWPCRRGIRWRHNWRLRYGGG